MTRRPRLFLPWLLLAAICSELMWLEPGEETIPYHVAWIGIALAYGFDPWPPRRTLVAVSCYTVVTGGILVVRAATGVVAWEETAEIPLMSMLVLLSIWHVRRRQSALAELTRMGARDRLRAGQRERLSQVTSHEMRTPLTIAVGYIELMLQRATDEDDRADLEVVRDELGRLSRASARLLRMLSLQNQVAWGPVNVDEFLADVGERWAAVADRRWLVEADVGTCEISAERLRACLDTLIENALRYTVAGDTVRLRAFGDDGTTYLGVADSGPGLSEEMASAVNSQDFRAARLATVNNPDSSRSQTGLGLGLVHEMVALQGGKVVAGRSEEGGAELLMAFPASRLRSGPRDVMTRPGVQHSLGV